MTTSHSSSNAFDVTTAVLPPALGFDDVKLLVGTANTSMAQLLKRQFSEWGYTVTLTPDADAVLNTVEQWEPDAVILDLDWCPHMVPNGDSDADAVTSEYQPMVIIALVPPDMPVADSGFPTCADAIIPYPNHPSDLVPWMHSLLRTKQRFEAIIAENQRLSEEAVQIERLRELIITVVIHEMSTPFVQTKGAIRLLKERLYHHVGEKEQQLIDMANQAINRMDESVESIRALHRTQNVTLAPTGLRDTIEVAKNTLARRESIKDQIDRITISLPSELPPVLADMRVLSSLLKQLLDNALKFSPPNTPVELIVEHDADADQVWIGVRDQGIGIAKEEQERIFHNFYQVDLTSTRAYGGLGNGLALAVLHAQSMNTTIEVESELGEGSTFSITLPVIHLDDI